MLCQHHSQYGGKIPVSTPAEKQVLCAAGLKEVSIQSSVLDIIFVSIRI